MYNHIRDFHKDQILHVVNNYMSQELRRHLMRECPSAYNALCGRVVVTARVEDTGDKVIERPNFTERED
jgi:predicted oxidoreductase (fatty acid repression mutant protein)